MLVLRSVSVKLPLWACVIALVDNSVSRTAQSDTVTNLPVPGRYTHLFLKLILGCHGLPVAAAQLTGAEQLYKGALGLGDERHLTFNACCLATFFNDGLLMRS